MRDAASAVPAPVLTRRLPIASPAKVNHMDALQGIKVLDLSEGIAGPIVGMFLADFGAEVIKVESPDGDPARSNPGFAMWNRGKSGVTVNPSDEARLAWLGAQIDGADILLTNGGAQLSRFGLDADDLLARNGRLILTEMPAYLHGYTPWAGGHESAALLSAIGGPTLRQSSVHGGPVDSVYPTLSYAHGVWASVCTVAALLERETSGAGQLVEVSGANALQHLAASSYVINPDAPDPSTAIGPAGRHPLYTRVLAGDGQWLGSGALGPKFETAMIKALGLSDMLNEERMGGIIQNLLISTNIEWAQKKVAEAFLAKPRDEWLEIMDSLGIPCGPMEDRDIWLDNPQVKAIGMRVEVEDPERGHVVMPGIPLNLVATPGRVQGPAPMLGQHNATVPTWAPQPPAVTLPPVRPGPLSGFTILNSGTFVASPYAGCLMAELGANVVKVEPPTGDPFRRAGYGVNRGMRSLSIDLQSPDGQAAFHEAVKSADVFIDGLRPGVTKKLNIDYDTLRGLNPGIVTMSLSAYGEGGPIGHKPGVDMVLQAMSGMMLAQGGDGEPVANTIALCDMTTAAMSSLTICLALFHKARTGEGQRAWDALGATATYLQGGELVRFDGRVPAPVGGEDYLGREPYDRIYPVSDGWIRIQATAGADAAAATRQALGLSGDALGDDPGAVIAAAVAGLSGHDAAAAFNDAGLAAVRVRRVSEVIRDPRLIASEFLHTRRADDGSFITDPGRYAVFSRTGRYGPKIPPGIGEHSTDALLAAGLDQDRIDKLIADGVVVQGGPMPHMLAASYR
jgi:crotonobetainyl-CoA:carnitine CoA-transferase CaiB-like acyl-CoA transferase